MPTTWQAISTLHDGADRDAEIVRKLSAMLTIQVGQSPRYVTRAHWLTALRDAMGEWGLPQAEISEADLVSVEVRDSYTLDVVMEAHSACFTEVRHPVEANKLQELLRWAVSIAFHQAPDEETV